MKSIKVKTANSNHKSAGQILYDRDSIILKDIHEFLIEIINHLKTGNTYSALVLIRHITKRVRWLRKLRQASAYPEVKHL